MGSVREGWLPRFAETLTDLFLAFGAQFRQAFGAGGWRVRRDGVGDACVRSRAAGFSALQPELARLCRGDAARPSSFLLRRDLRSPETQQLFHLRPQ